MVGRPRATLVAATVASGITSLPTTALGVTLPTIQHEFNANLSQLQWTLTAYSLAYASLLVAAGRLGDIFGHRRLFLSGLCVFGVAAVSAALASSVLWLILSLAVIGAGAAMIVPASLSILTNQFEGHGRVKAIAVWGGASGLVSGLGPVVGGILTGEAGWPAIFWVTAAIALFVFIVAYRGIAESRDEEASHRIDYPGVVCLAGGITLLSFGLIQGPPNGWTSTPALVGFGASAAFFAALWFVERRSPSPILDLSLLRHRNFVGGMAVKFVVNFVLASLLFLIPLYLREILGYSAVKAGVLLLPLSATFLVSLPLGARMMERYGPRRPMVIGLVLATFSLAFISNITIETTYSDLWPPMLALGFAVGLVLTPMNVVSINAVPVRQHGEATGILTTVIGIGSVMGVALTTAVFRTLEDNQLDRLLKQAGHVIPDSVERTLEGILSHAASAEAALDKFPPTVQRDIVGAVRLAFVYAISNALWVAVGMAALGVVVTMVVLRGAKSPPKHVAFPRVYLPKLGLKTLGPKRMLPIIALSSWKRMWQWKTASPWNVR
jgi:EmrB/QacA subfamily drug resistance transporter